MKRKRVIGTTREAIAAEEVELGKKLPESFITWLIENYGTDLDGVHIYPVSDPRDVRKTWESLSHNLSHGWASWLEVHEDSGYDFRHLLPFADFGTGDYYCFDYSDLNTMGEPKVVHWSHETAETEFRAEGFEEFTIRLEDGDFEYD